jgi:hypothetical protein
VTDRWQLAGTESEPARGGGSVCHYAEVEGCDAEDNRACLAVPQWGLPGSGCSVVLALVGVYLLIDRTKKEVDTTG